MGQLLPAYKKAIIDELLNSISSNTSQYYACGSNPTPWVGNTPVVTSDDYTATFSFNWNLIFGKRLANSDILPVINNVPWTSNTVYTQYDNLANTLSTGGPFYVVTEPVLNGPYNIFKCIYNNGGGPSLQIPDQVQPGTFQKSDGYMWRYITTISFADYSNFATETYVPIYPNTAIVANASLYAGIDVVQVTNAGSGYQTLANDTVLAVVNSTLIQIGITASQFNDFYTNSGIYIFNNLSSTSQLNSVKHYVSNTSGNWIFLSTPANTTNIIPATTMYTISPQVVFTSDADILPQAYTVVDTSDGSIDNIVVVDPGSGLTWANAAIVSNTTYGSGATAYAIAPPQGGHGSNPEIELFVQGYCVSFDFANTESNTIPVGINYNRIGIIKNPFVLEANGSQGVPYANETFTQLLTGTVSPSTLYGVGEQVSGVTSGALGTIAFSNSTTVWLTGDKSFVSGEFITDGSNTTVLTINTIGEIFVENQHPLYIQNISNVARSNTTTEAFQLIIQV